MGCLCVWSIARAQSIKPINNAKTQEVQQTNTDILVFKREVSSVQQSTRDSRNSNAHSIKSERKISEDSLRRFLEQKQSPLADYAGILLRSDYYSTIIGISAIEQQYCHLQPTTSPYNCFGMMSGGHLIKYSGFPEAISALDAFLSKNEEKRPTIEKLNCWYVQPCSSNWLNTVINTKELVENLPQ